MERLKKPDLILDKFSLLRPNNLALMDEDKLMAYAKRVTELITDLGQGHMFEVTPEEIVNHFRRESAIVALDPNDQSVAGFVKYFPWLKEDKPVAYEVGSLVVAPEYQNQGLGKRLTFEMTWHLRKSDNGIPIIAVVVEDNIPSIKVLTKLGWQIITHQQSLELLQGVDILEGWPYPSKIFLYPSNKGYGGCR